MLELRVGTSHSAVVSYALVLIGGVTTLVVTLVLFDVPVGQLILGGALTSVFVGIAAQQALSNVFAGMVLLLARPFRVGDAIRLRAGALAGGQIDGTVTEIGITYVRLDTGASAWPSRTRRCSTRSSDRCRPTGGRSAPPVRGRPAGPAGTWGTGQQ